MGVDDGQDVQRGGGGNNVLLLGRLATVPILISSLPSSEKRSGVRKTLVNYSSFAKSGFLEDEKQSLIWEAETLAAGKKKKKVGRNWEDLDLSPLQYKSGSPFWCRHLRPFLSLPNTQFPAQQPRIKFSCCGVRDHSKRHTHAQRARRTSGREP